MANKKKNPKDQKKLNKKLNWIVAMVALVLLIAIVTIILLVNSSSGRPAGNPQTTVNQPIEIDPENQNMVHAQKPEEVKKNKITGVTDAEIMPLGELGEGLTLTRAGRYSGKFVEDGSNRPVEDVLAVIVTNESDHFVEYAQIAAVSEGRNVQFQLTSLPAGHSVLVMEKSGVCYEDGMSFEKAILQTVTKPDKEFSLYPETFEIKAADGVVNLVNRTENDYPGKIAIYFKNAENGIYVGGITYSRTLDNGIPGKGVAQFMAENYTVAGSELVFLVYEH